MPTAPRHASVYSAAAAAQMLAEREDRGWSQAEVARRAELDRVTYLRLEKHTRIADMTQVASVCAAFSIPVSEFLRRVEARLTDEVSAQS